MWAAISKTDYSHLIKEMGSGCGKKTDEDDGMSGQEIGVIWTPSG